MKQGVGEPNSQMGKSYANSALRRANQYSRCALPRDWLALEEGGVEPPGFPALPIQVYASSRLLLHTRAHEPELSPRSPSVPPRLAGAQETHRPPLLRALGISFPVPHLRSLNPNLATKAPVKKLLAGIYRLPKCP